MKVKKIFFILFGFVFLAGPDRFVHYPENADIIKKAFGEIFLTYPELHNKKIYLVFHNRSASLMQAWPTFEPDTYLVFVSANPKVNGVKLGM